MREGPLRPEEGDGHPLLQMPAGMDNLEKNALHRFIRQGAAVALAQPFQKIALAPRCEDWPAVPGFDRANRLHEAPAPVQKAQKRFVDPVDAYSLTYRAQKYGFLFIAIGFGAFMLFELLRAVPIHPVQYSLVGLALATFFLLLLGLSEHVDFALSYLAASFACVAQLAYYLTNALGGKRYGLSFAALLATLFGALYVLLVSEDNALILGATLVFALVTVALIMTRRFDWYAFGDGKPR